MHLLEKCKKILLFMVNNFYRALNIMSFILVVLIVIIIYRPYISGYVFSNDIYEITKLDLEARNTVKDLLFKMESRFAKGLPDVDLSWKDTLRNLKWFDISAISFHYADEQYIKVIYNDYFMEPTIENLVSEIISENSGDIHAGLLKVVDAKTGVRDLNKWISTIKLPDISINEMYKRYQREIVRKNQVILNLEDLDVDLEDHLKFENIVSELKTKYNIDVDPINYSETIINLKAKAAEKTMRRLEESSGWVLVSGKFTITELNNDYYKLVYLHPVNDYLPPTASKVTITVTINKNAINENYIVNYSQSIGSAIPIRLYGKIWHPIDRETDNFELSITPVAIY